MKRPLAAVLLLLPGCAGEGGRYPSLQPRAVERAGFDEPVRPAVAVVAEPALDAELKALGGRLDTIAAGFGEAEREAARRAAAAKGKAAGSDAWLDAQTALGQLDDWRAQASALATDVEQVQIARAATLAPSYPALADLDERVEAEAARQGAAIARLQAMLAPA